MVVTASDGKRELLEAFEAGADDFITKPPDPHELVARLRALVRRCEGLSVAPTGTDDSGHAGQAEPAELLDEQSDGVVVGHGASSKSTGKPGSCRGRRRVMRSRSTVMPPV